MKISEITEIAPDNSKYMPSPLLPSNTMIGIEVELENYRFRDGDGLRYWNFTRDGSLRNNGIEIVLTRPACGQTLVEAIDELRGFFERHPEVEANDRCSVHVHLDFRDSDAKQVYQFCMVYSILEDILLEASGGDKRAHNIFCCPVSKSDEVMQVFGKLNEDAYDAKTKQRMRQTIINNIKSAIYTANKYTSINIASLAHTGSVEVRIHEGEKNVDNIFSWVKALMCIKKFADTRNIDFDRLFRMMSENGGDFFLREIFTDKDAFNYIYQPPEVSYGKMINGIRVAQDIHYSYDIRVQRAIRADVIPKKFLQEDLSNHPLLPKTVRSKFKNEEEKPKKRRGINRFEEIEGLPDDPFVDREEENQIREWIARPPQPIGGVDANGGEPDGVQDLRGPFFNRGLNDDEEDDDDGEDF